VRRCSGERDRRAERDNARARETWRGTGEGSKKGIRSRVSRKGYESVKPQTGERAVSDQESQEELRGRLGPITLRAVRVARDRDVDEKSEEH